MPEAGDAVPASGVSDAGAEKNGGFQVGAKVQLIGLISKPENNGRSATIIEYLPEKERYLVEFPGGGSSKLKPENLQLPPPPAPELEAISVAPKRERASKRPRSRERSGGRDGDGGKRARVEEGTRTADSPSSRAKAAAPCPQAAEPADSGGVSCDRASSFPRSVRISKALARILRHTAVNLGIEIQSDGFVKVERLLQVSELNALGCTMRDIELAVNGNDKKRFELREVDGEPMVRAAQGHSMKQVADESLLRRLEAEDPHLPRVCVHGTYRRHLESIKQKGLLAGGGIVGRNHVHFAPFEPGDGRVISGMRYNCELAVYLDLRGAIQAGIPFYVSSNEVILTPGLDGVVPPRFFKAIRDLHGGGFLEGTGDGLMVPGS